MRKFSILLLIGFSVQAWSAVVLKDIQVSEGQKIELQFDSDVAARNVNVEFLRDIVQFNINQAAVYPAKIVSVPNSELSKIFAYQYTPNLVRCRLTVAGKAEDFKHRILWKINKRSLTIEIPAMDKITTQSARAVSADLGKDSKSKKDNFQSVLSPSELPEAQKSNKNSSVTTKLGKPDSDTAAMKSAPQPLTGAKELPKALKSFAALSLVFAVIGIGFFALRRSSGRGGFKKKISKLMGGSLGSGKGKMIEILANHYLGPKKSITVARIQGRLLVIGVTDENVNLICELDDEESVAGVGMDAMESPIMASEPVLKPARGATFQNVLSGKSDVRGKIRERLEGLKTL